MGWFVGLLHSFEVVGARCERPDDETDETDEEDEEDERRAATASPLPVAMVLGRVLLMNAVDHGANAEQLVALR
jgi:hypothetical protein